MFHWNLIKEVSSFLSRRRSGVKAVMQRLIKKKIDIALHLIVVHYMLTLVHILSSGPLYVYRGPYPLQRSTICLPWSISSLVVYYMLTLVHIFSSGPLNVYLGPYPLQWSSICLPWSISSPVVHYMFTLVHILSSLQWSTTYMFTSVRLRSSDPLYVYLGPSPLQWSAGPALVASPKPSPATLVTPTTGRVCQTGTKIYILYIIIHVCIYYIYIYVCSLANETNKYLTRKTNNPTVTNQQKLI